MSKKKKILLALVGIWIFAMIATAPEIIQAWKERGSVERAFNGYGSALVRQQFNEAYGYGTAEFHDAISRDQFIHLQEQIQADWGTLQQVSEHAVNVTVPASGEPTAVIKANFRYQRKEMRVICTLHKEDTAWHVFGCKEQ